MHTALSTFYHFLAHDRNLLSIKDAIGAGGGIAVFKFVPVGDDLTANLRLIVPMTFISLNLGIHIIPKPLRHSPAKSTSEICQLAAGMRNFTL